MAFVARRHIFRDVPVACALPAKDFNVKDMASDALEQSLDERPLRRSLFRGLRCKCPSCGSGPMLKGFLKVRDHCSVCGEELHHHRADDGPAYLTILLTGHLMIPVIMVIWETYRPEPAMMAAILVVICVTIALYLLPRMKGLIVAFQWAKRMHGFGRA